MCISVGEAFVAISEAIVDITAALERGAKGVAGSAPES